MLFTKEASLRMYEDLVFGRKMGEKIVENILSGRINGAIHPSLGQEAISAGILAAKYNSKYNIYTHCTHRQQPLIAKNIGIDPFLGELMNKKTGLMRGISGEYHIVSLENKHLPMCGILGAGVMSSTGYAWALKLNKAEAVVICSMGDGAMSEGATYEAINLAAIHKLPIVYLIENNNVAMSTDNSEQAPHEDMYLRAHGYNIPGMKIDGNKVEEVASALIGAVEMAANGQPVMIEAKTCRWQGHYVGDMQERYRDTNFLNNKDKIDPVKLYEKILTDRGYADEAWFLKINAEQDAILNEGFERAINAERPCMEDCVNYNNLYSNDEGGDL